MADLCAICQVALDDQPRTELLCHHSFHTNCLFRRIAIDHFDTHCVSCEANLFPEEEDTASVSSSRVGKLYDTNTRFRKQIKYYSYIRSSMNKHSLNFKKLIHQKKLELAEPYEGIKARYELLYNQKKNDILQSAQYKDYRATRVKLFHSYSALQNRYALTKKDIESLNRKPGLRSLQAPGRWRYRSRPCFMIAKSLRLRLPEL